MTILRYGRGIDLWRDSPCKLGWVRENVVANAFGIGNEA